MIVSITFRHGTEENNLRQWVKTQCVQFQKYNHNITRIDVVFSKQTRHRHSDSSSLCHISLQAAGKKRFDIYEYHAYSGGAFNQAHERLTEKLSQRNSGKPINRNIISRFQEQALVENLQIG